MSGGEEKVLTSLAQNGGEMLQSEVVGQTGLSRSRTSEILSMLERKSLVSRFPIGKNYRVILETELRRTRKHHHLRLGFTRSAEYPFIVPFRKKIRDALGIEIHFQIYENGLDVARDLSLSRLDLGIAPILASFMFCSLGAPFTIIAPAGSGGSSVVTANRGLSFSEPRVATTKLSTMELLMKTSIHEHFLAERTMTIYASNSQEITKGLISKRFDAACIWEPYATILTKKHGLSKIVTYSDLEDHVCCTLSASNTLSDRVVSKISRQFKDSIVEFSRTPDSFLDQYSQITNFDQRIIHAASREYKYSTELESNSITRQFEHAGVTTPDPSTVKEMIRSAE